VRLDHLLSKENMGLLRGAVLAAGTGGVPCHYEVVKAEARSDRSGLFRLSDTDTRPAIAPERLPVAAPGILESGGSLTRGRSRWVSPIAADKTAAGVMQASGLGRAPLPDALARKYPGADRQWIWQWVFPASSHYVDAHTGVRHRHHLHESVIQRAVRRRSAKRECPNPRPLTASGIRSPPTSWKRGTTSGRSRSCSGTRT
jgi:hypothetical protein